MSKVLITADIHFGLPHKTEDILWAVKTIREYARQNQIKHIFVLGDLFHDRENLNISVLNSCFDFFRETKYEYDQDWIIFPGNHDMFLRNSWDINSLKSLSDNITLIDSISLIKLYGQNFWVVPFVHYESVYMKIIDELHQKINQDDILLTHVGVNNATLNECYLLKNWSIVEFNETKFKHVFAGHFHCHQNVGKVWYPGSPIPYRFDEGMVPHGFIEYEIISEEIKFIPIFGLELVGGKQPPDYVTITDDMLSDVGDYDLSGDNVRVRLNKDYSKDEISNIRSELEKFGVSHVKFSKFKEDNIELDESIKSIDFKIDSPIDLFNRWIKHDNPKNLSVELLQKLNKEIVDG